MDINPYACWSCVVVLRQHPLHKVRTLWVWLQVMELYVTSWLLIIRGSLELQLSLMEAWMSSLRTLKVLKSSQTCYL